MTLVYDMWARVSYSMVAFSAQMSMLAAFAYALTNEVYEYWIKQRIWAYYILCLINIVILFFGVGAGMYYYLYGSGYFQFLGANLAFFVSVNCGPIFIVICTSMNVIGTKYYGKPVE